MSPENKKLEFLKSCGIFLEEQVQITPEKTAGVKTAFKYKKVAFFSAQKPQVVEGIQCWLFTSFTKSMLSHL